MGPKSGRKAGVGDYAHKKGEVVEPAGGETGGPRCLAEVRELPMAALSRQFKLTARKFNFSERACQTKK
jgi:hypothetical protein